MVQGPIGPCQPHHEDSEEPKGKKGEGKRSKSKGKSKRAHRDPSPLDLLKIRTPVQTDLNPSPNLKPEPAWQMDSSLQ